MAVTGCCGTTLVIVLLTDPWTTGPIFLAPPVGGHQNSSPKSGDPGSQVGAP